MHKDTLERVETYPNFKDCSIQTFNDQDKTERSQSRILEVTEENLEKCAKLQKLMPYGIYFSVNPMENWKRDKASVKFIQTWICDIDTGTKEEQTKLIENAPLSPTYVNESVHGFHIFYLAEKHLTEQEFTNGNTGLANYYHGDMKVVKDTARVLRIPWFYHMKWEPELVKYRDDLSCGYRYSTDQMLLAFPFQDEEIEQPKPEIKPIEKKWSCDDSYRYKVNNLDNKQMLLELSGTRWINGEIISFKPCSTWEQILCDGKLTSCWIDKSWMIWSYDKGWPCYIQFIERYLKRKLTTSEWNEFAKRVNSNHPELEDKKEQVRFDVTKVEKKEISWLQRGFLYPSEVFDEFECFLWWELVTIIAETNSGKTTFAMDMIKRNTSLKRKCFYINLEFDIRNVWKDKWLWFHGKTKKNISDLDPLTEEEQKDMEKYIQQNLALFESYSNPNWIDLEDLEKLLVEKSQEWYELFVVDSFSRIHWNLDSQTARTSQNRCMEELQELVQKLNIAVVMLHHTNRNWTFEGSQKIKDLSNVFILIEKEKNEMWDEYRKYILSKDKFVHNKEVNACYRMWKYEQIYD